jgi:hypothetical protein
MQSGQKPVCHMDAASLNANDAGIAFADLA